MCNVKINFYKNLFGLIFIRKRTIILWFQNYLM